MLKDLFTQRLYIQLSPERVLMRDPKSNKSVDEVPEIAVQRPVGGKAVIVAVGAEARSAAAQPDTTVHNPFAHPRSLVSDFTLAEHVLKGFVQRLRGNRLLLPSPVIVIHPLGEHAGGLTQVEVRALQELALGAGASSVKVWQGPALTDDQLLSGDLPASGKVLNV